MNTIKRMLALPVLAAALLVPAIASAQAVAPLTEGEVRKVDQEAGKLTIRHGDIKHLDMPAMTMVFTVKDKSMLAAVKPGDKIRFAAVKEGGKLFVTEMQPAPQ
jgi:Cu(I)/Ag(I) efflux system protein CusF